MNGQRFHERKRIETKTEQCERSLCLACCRVFKIQEHCIVNEVCLENKAKPEI